MANLFMQMAFPNLAQAMDEQSALQQIAGALNFDQRLQDPEFRKAITPPGGEFPVKDPNSGVNTLLNQSTKNPIINNFKLQYLQGQQQARAQQQAAQEYRDYQNQAIANLYAQNPNLPIDNPGLDYQLTMAAQNPEMAKLFAPGINQNLEPFSLSPGQTRFTGPGRVIAKGGPDLEKLDQQRQQQFTNATTLRNQFVGVTKDYDAQNEAYGRIIASASEPSPAGDTSLVYNYMKVLDPTSTVRESEFEMLARSGSLGTQFQNWIEKASTGKFSDNLRKDIVNRATKLFKQATDQHRSKANEFRGLAVRQGVAPENVVFERQTIQPLTEQQAPPPPKGFVIDQ